MGVSEKLQVDLDMESEGKKWVIAGIPLRAPLKPIYVKPADKEAEISECDENSTTPTGEESRIRTNLICPPAPVKREATLKGIYGGSRQFFTPPDLETVFTRRRVDCRDS